GYFGHPLLGGLSPFPDGRAHHRFHGVHSKLGQRYFQLYVGQGRVSQLVEIALRTAHCSLQEEMDDAAPFGAMLATAYLDGPFESPDRNGFGGDLAMARSRCTLPASADRRHSVDDAAWHNLYHGTGGRLLSSGVGEGFFASKVLTEELPGVVVVS